MGKAVLVMDMPSSCDKCPCFCGHYSDMCCMALNNRTINYPYPKDFRQSWCPLKELPELADKKNKEETERKIRELQERISSDSKKLAELTSNFPVHIDEELDKYKKTIEFMKKIGI